MKKVVSAALAIMMCLMASTAFAQSFSDIPQEHACYEAVESVSQLGYMNGMGDGTFGDTQIKRAELATVLCRILGFPAVSQANTKFSDVPAEHWASGYIAIVGELNLIPAWEDGLFHPDETISNADALHILMVVLGYGEKVDFAAENPYYEAARANGLVLEGELLPADNAAMRTDVAQLIYRAQTK